MNKKIKIAHILWGGRIGGTQEYVTSLVKNLDKSKYDIHLCFLSRKGDIYEEARNIERITVDYIGIKSGYDILGAAKLFLYYFKQNFDIVHSHCPDVLSNIVLFFCVSCKKILTEHVAPAEDHFYKKRKRFYTIFKNMFEKIIVISNYVKKDLVNVMGVDPEKIIVVHNCLSTEKYYKSTKMPDDLTTFKSNSNRIIGFIGRMEPFKRPLLFVQIAKEIVNRNDKYLFVMVGNGAELSKCKATIEEMGIENKIRLLGFRRDIPELLNLFDALLFLSYGEGFGIVLIEAMAAGVPVFAIDEGAVPEIVRNGENGILLNTLVPEEIAAKIINCFEDRDLIGNIRKHALQDVNNRFAMEVCAAKIENIYNELIKS